MTRLIADILAQRRDEGEGGWLQLLVFAVMAVFFVISNIAKARARKQQQGQEEQEEELTFQIPPMRRRPIPQPKPPAGGPKIFSHKIPQPAVKEIAVSQAIEGLQAGALTAAHRAAKHEIEVPSVELIGLEKPEELARGIVYSEILGKPLALREPWGYE